MENHTISVEIGEVVLAVEYMTDYRGDATLLAVRVRPGKDGTMPDISGLLSERATAAIQGDIADLYDDPYKAPPVVTPVNIKDLRVL